MILSLNIPINQWGSLIYDSIDNKYENLDRETILVWVRDSINFVKHHKNINCLHELSRDVIDAETDVRNQTLTLLLIEIASEENLPIKLPLETLHRCLKGPVKNVARSTEVVVDFGGVAPTPIQEATGRFYELQQSVAALSQVNGIKNARENYLILAYVFSSVIRIHYFADDNGRTARMAVQFLCKMWGLPYVGIPKVRNDQEWKNSLLLGLSGDYSSLATEMTKRVLV